MHSINQAAQSYRLPAEGFLLGALGVLGFSFTLPATRIAVAQLDATVVGLGRAVVAAVLALAVLGIRREALPSRRLWLRIAMAGMGVVVGFPLFSALALKHLTSAHSAVIVGLLPAATAVMAVARAGERPTPGFWVACACGLAGIGLALTLPIITTLTAEMFGIQRAGIAVSLNLAVGQVASTISGVLLGYILDATGSFTRVWSVGLAVAACGIVPALGLRRLEMSVAAGGHVPPGAVPTPNHDESQEVL